MDRVLDAVIFLMMFVFLFGSIYFVLEITHKKLLKKMNIELTGFKKGSSRYLIEVAFSYNYNEKRYSCSKEFSCTNLITGEGSFGIYEAENMEKFNNLNFIEKRVLIRKHLGKIATLILKETKKEITKQNANKAWENLPDEF